MPEVIMPRLSDTMEEGVLSRWLKKEGDAVRQGEVIGEIDTDKATMELESFDDGILEKLLVPEGATVAIGQPLAVIGDGSGGVGGTTTAGTAPGAAPATTPPSAADGQPSAAVPTVAAEVAVPVVPAAAAGPSARLLSSPLARREAARHGLDPATITGTGPGGRIVRADVDAAVAAAEARGAAPAGEVRQPGQAPSAPPQQPGQAPSSSAPAQPAQASADSVEVPLTQMRKVTARRLTESAAAPHFYLTVVVGVDALFRFRADVNERFSDRNIKVSVTDLLVRACAVTLRSHPGVNSSWAGDRILAHRRINVGVAVALDDGLIVPVVTSADTKTLDQIAVETRALAEKARAGSLSLQEFSGGTFTISNLGMFGIDNFTAVINPPEAAILAVGATTEEPYVQDGELLTRRIMKITLTSDHRVLDGAKSAAFLSDLKRNLEDPLRIVI
jgi:pyruvate dehydrogenase E2 component (dihydrolipoamide acetyltransferase)